MRFARSTLVAVLAVVVCAYAVDCSAQTPRQASECCHSMKCSTHAHHGMSCCKTMSATRADLGEGSAHIDGSVSLAMMGPVQVLTPAAAIDFANGTSAQCHAPPESDSSAVSPLRI